MYELTRQSNKKHQKKYSNMQKLPLLEKKPKFKVEDKMIFGLIRETSTKVVKEKENHQLEIQPQLPKMFKKRKREGTFNTGRWLPDEHHRFIEALLKFGNEWKSVQKHVGTRSSTQARSHAQKFFVKIGKTKIENLNLDFANNSLKSLNQMANNLDNEQMSKAIQILNKIAYDKKSKCKTINNDDEINLSEININLQDYTNLNISIELKEEPTKRKRIRTSKRAKKLRCDESIKTFDEKKHFCRKNSIDYYMQHYPIVNFMKDNMYFNNNKNITYEEDYQFNLFFQPSLKFEYVDFDLLSDFYLDDKNIESQSTQRRSSTENDIDILERYLDCK